MREHRIINRKQLSEAETAEMKKADPYYRHRKERVELRLKSIGLPQKEIEKRMDLLMELEMANKKYQIGSVR